MSRPKVKQIPKHKKQATPPAPSEPKSLGLEKKDLLFPLPGFLVQAIIIALIGVGFYYNSTNNEYALDDGIVIVQNEFVQEGLSGIDDILGKDAFHSYYSQMGGGGQELSGGRYRPLSIVTFAIEQEILGKDTDPKTPYVRAEEEGLTWLRHFVNVLLYAFSGVVLLYLLSKYIFRNNPDVAFLATLIFIIHPIHTEAVANTKSRDEIMSLLFITLTLISVLRYHASQKTSVLVWGGLFFFLALLSKEYAITLLGLIPILLYVHNRYSMSKALYSTLPFFAIAIVYIFIRVGAVGMTSKDSPEVLNNPYLYASSIEKVATKIYMPWNYIRLLFWPDPLSSDYSYAHYAYRKMGDPMVWASLLIHLGIVITGFVLLVRRHILAFAIFFYLFNLALVANFGFNIGATMGERLIYHSSLGFVLVIAYLTVEGFSRLSAPLMAKRLTLGAATLAIVALSGYKVVNRNPDWENDYTLFTKDVNTVPNSVLANGNAGAQYINSADWPESRADSALVKPGELTPTQRRLIEKGIGYLQHAVTIHPKYVNGYLNLGLGHYKLGNYDKAGQNWAMAYKYFPSNPYLKNYSGLLLGKAFQLGSEKKYNEAIVLMEHAANINPNDPEIWYNLGGAYFSVQRFDKSREAWNRCLQLKPDHADAKRGMGAIPPGQ
jgi:protein O-mannosyl-transferase